MNVVGKLWLMFMILLVECIFGLRIELMVLLFVVWKCLNGSMVFLIEIGVFSGMWELFCFGSMFLVCSLVIVEFVIMWFVVFVIGMLSVFDMKGIVWLVCGFVLIMYSMLVLIVNCMFSSLCMLMFLVMVRVVLWMWLMLVWLSEIGGRV